MFVVKLLSFITSDAASVHSKAGGEGGFNSWTRTHASDKKFGFNASQSPLQNFDI